MFRIFEVDSRELCVAWATRWDTCEHEPDVVGVFLFFSVNDHVSDDAICFYVTIYSLVMSYCKNNVYTVYWTNVCKKMPH